MVFRRSEKADFCSTSSPGDGNSFSQKKKKNPACGWSVTVTHLDFFIFKCVLQHGLHLAEAFNASVDERASLTHEHTQRHRHPIRLWGRTKKIHKYLTPIPNLHTLMKYKFAGEGTEAYTLKCIAKNILRFVHLHLNINWLIILSIELHWVAMPISLIAKYIYIVRVVKCNALKG